MLQVKDLVVDHGAIRALNGVSFEISVGEIAAVIGSNGAGKTTLLRSLSGLLKPTSGSAEWSGKSILQQKPENLVRQGIVHVSDGKSVITELTVEENLTLGGIWRKDKAQVKKITADVLEIFPILRERLSQRADTLSGGERQMLAMGRALIANPKLLLLDEPSLGLAPLIIEQIFQIIKRLRYEFGLTVLLVEQNAVSALEIADKGIVINLGVVVASDSAASLKSDPVLAKAYLGY